jgi:hypothetical protein
MKEEVLVLLLNALMIKLIYDCTILVFHAFLSSFGEIDNSQQFTP